jgi:mannonate dehydratase
VKTAPHGAPDLSPICFAAHMHLNIWAPNFGIQEFVGFGNEQLNEIFPHRYEVKNGTVAILDAPGLGVDFDESAAQKYPYKRSYLPVSRLEDGTVWNW